jgi:hypothetical protein
MNKQIIQRTFDIPDALQSLRPHAIWHSPEQNYESIVWVSKDISQPTIEEVQAEIVRLQTDWDENEYRRWRDINYPMVGDQLDDLYHAGAFSPEMEAKIRAIKEQYPKPTAQ